MSLQIVALGDLNTLKKPSPWKVVSSETLLRDEWISLRADCCEREDRTLIDRYYVLTARNWVNILPVCDDGVVTLVHEYRHGYGSTLLGLPGGLIDAEEPAHVAAHRELLEETGLHATQLIKTGEMVTNPSTHTNVGLSYLALLPPSSQLTAKSLESDLRLVHLPLRDVVSYAFSKNSLLSGYDVASILRGVSTLAKSYPPHTKLAEEATSALIENLQQHNSGTEPSL